MIRPLVIASEWRFRCSVRATLIALSGHDPLTAFGARAVGAVGSKHQIGVALNRNAPDLINGAPAAVWISRRNYQNRR